MNHHSMMLALTYLAESGLAKSGDIAESLKISRKHASVILSRCFRRKFVSRRPYKHGRVRGYVYKLTDKGEEWLLYKASQKKNVDLHDRKPMIEVRKESIYPVSYEMLNLKQNQQTSKDFSLEMGLLTLAMTTVNSYAREHQSLKQQDDLLILLLIKRSSERDFACYLYRMEHEEKLKLLNESQNENTSRQHESFHRGLAQGIERGLELGLKLGIEIGETRTLVRTQGTLDRILLKKISGNSQFNNPRCASDPVHTRAQRRDEEFVGENVYPYCNRWWNFLPTGSGISLPFRGPIRGS